MKKILAFILSTLFFSIGAFAQFNLQATQAAYIDGVTDEENKANEHGVYPVLISWDRIPEASAYSILRGLNPEEMTEIGIVTTTAYIDTNPSAVPNEKYHYGIVAYTENENKHSEVVTGYGALTRKAYMCTYNKTMYTSHGKFVLMNRKSNLSKLGKEEINGTYSGTCTYQTSVKGLAGIVTMKYTNYCDNEGWILNGYTNTKANISANGNMFGTMIVSGMYPGTIVYDNMDIKKGNAGGGYYIIEQEGFERGTLDWDQVPEEIIANELLESEDKE